MNDLHDIIEAVVLGNVHPGKRVWTGIESRKNFLFKEGNDSRRQVHDGKKSPGKLTYLIEILHSIIFCKVAFLRQ